MSRCSCYSKNSEEGGSIWKRLVTKYENRIEELTKRRCEIRHRLEVMQMKMPAHLCSNMMNMPAGASEYLENFIKKLQTPKKPNVCRCDPCLTKIPENFPQNLYEYTYSSNINAPTIKSPGYTQSKPRQKSVIKNSICSCDYCAKMVIQRLKQENENETLVTPKPSIKNICNCEICKSMIPEKLCTPKLTNPTANKTSVGKKIVCTCATDAKVLKESNVCECDVCAEAVIQRINSPDLNFEPLRCGCDGSGQPEQVLDIDIPICQCNSCKTELSKRLGEEKKTTNDECFCKSDQPLNQICNCSICATSALQEKINECDCKVGEGAEIPICSCDTCKKAIETKPEEPKMDIESICNCDTCMAARKEIQQATKVPSFDTTCICDCDICNGKIPKPDEPKKPCDGEVSAQSSNSSPSAPASPTSVVSCDCISTSDVIAEEPCVCMPKPSPSCSCESSTTNENSPSGSSTSCTCTCLTESTESNVSPCPCFEASPQPNVTDSCTCSTESVSVESPTQDTCINGDSLSCTCSEGSHVQSPAGTPKKTPSTSSKNSISQVCSCFGKTPSASIKGSTKENSPACSCFSTKEGSTKEDSIKKGSTPCLCSYTSSFSVSRVCSCSGKTPSASIKEGSPKENSIKEDSIPQLCSCISSKNSTQEPSINSGSGEKDTSDYSDSSSLVSTSSSEQQAICCACSGWSSEQSAGDFNQENKLKDDSSKEIIDLCSCTGTIISQTNTQSSTPSKQSASLDDNDPIGSPKRNCRCHSSNQSSSDDGDDDDDDVTDEDEDDEENRVYVK